MTTLFLIVLALAVYFAVASRERDAEVVEALEVDDALKAEILED